MPRKIVPSRIADSDRPLEPVAKALAEAGFPANLCGVLAEGYVARLRRRAWQRLSDNLGNGDDVETLAGYEGPPRVLTAALAGAKFLRADHGIYLLADAVTEAPCYVQSRWKAWAPESYRVARSRASAPALPLETVPESKPEPADLFGAAAPLKPAADQLTISGFKQFVEYWHEHYLAAEGVAYPWRAADFRFVKFILQATGTDWHDAAAAASAYLADRTQFYRGHELRRLYTDLCRFRTSAAGRGSQSGFGSAAATTQAQR